MSDARTWIAFSLSRSQQVLDLFLADLKPEDYLHRPVPKANCAAWIVGHLTLAERRWLKEIGAGDLPSLPDGFEKRFARDEHAPIASEFGDVSILRPLFNAHRQRLVDAVKVMDETKLDRPLDKPHPRFATLGELLQFAAIHTAMHAGQISTIRRSLGKPPLM